MKHGGGEKTSKMVEIMMMKENFIKLGCDGYKI